MARQYVFGYGSLAGLPSAGGKIVHAAGLRRAWNVAMDNRVSQRGYKFYVDPETGERPQVYVTFLNLVPARDSTANGVLLPAEDETVLSALDARERNYERSDITGQVLEPVNGRVWAYLGTPAARQRYEEGARSGRAVVDARYREEVVRQFALLGVDAAREFAASTDEPRCPVRHLRRVDL